MPMRRRWSRIALRTVALAAVALVLSSCGMWPWRGISNVELPGGPGTGSERMTIYVQMPDTLALNVNSRVRVADVFVGRVRAIELKNWVATLTLDLEPNLGSAVQRTGQDRTDQPSGQPARGTGAAAGSVGRSCATATRFR